MTTPTQSITLDIQTCQCAQGFMAWVHGHHRSFATGRSPKEAIGALVMQEPQFFNVRKVYYR